MEAVQGEAEVQAEATKIKNKQATLEQKERMREVTEEIQRSRKEGYVRAEEHSAVCEEQIAAFRREEQRGKEAQRERVQAEQARGRESRILH